MDDDRTTPGAEVCRTERMVLRRWTRVSHESLLRIYGDADAMRWVDDGEAITPAECDRWIDVTLANYETRGYGMFELTARSDGTTLGFMGLVHPDGQSDAELKYALARSAWGGGAATEAGHGLLAWGARSHGLDAVIATIHPDNHASQRIVGKLGFVREPDRIQPDGERTRVYRWSLR